MKPIADGLWVDSIDGPRLVGATCIGCDSTTFPSQDSCPRCGGETMERRLLARDGLLWTFTVQRYAPKSPPFSAAKAAEPFEPFGVGYVDLGDLLVEGLLEIEDPARLCIGMPMEVTIARFVDGVSTYAFRPKDAASNGC